MSMTPEGFKILTEALNETGLKAEVTPVPEPGEDVPVVEIRTNQMTPFRLLAAALISTELMRVPGSESYAGKAVPRNAGDRPELVIINNELRVVSGSDHRYLQPAARFTAFADLNAVDNQHF